MEARGNRSYFEEHKYNTANWRYNWTARSFQKTDCFPSKPFLLGDSPERQPYYFPQNLAFLCSKEQFNWELEVWEVVGEKENLELNLDSKITAKITGLGIPFPTNQTLRFNEVFVPLDDTHQLRTNDPMNPLPVGIRGWKYWIEEMGRLERIVRIEGNPIGLTDLVEYEKQWEFRAHGRLLDMAVYIS